MKRVFVAMTFLSALAIAQQPVADLWGISSSGAATPPPPPPPPPAQSSGVTPVVSQAVLSSLAASSALLVSSSAAAPVPTPVPASSANLVKTSSASVAPTPTPAPTPKPAPLPVSSAVVVAKVSSSSVAPISSQAAPLTKSDVKPVSGIGSTNTPTGTSSASSAANADSSKSGDKGTGAPSFTGGVAVGLMTIDGQQVTRISFRPEVSVGPLGIGLDLELFVNSEGKFLSKGWQFDTKDETLNSLYRKLYYLRWNQPGDRFYVRVGALEGITMDAAGLVTSNYGNVANYPDQKMLGTDLQFNNWLDPINASIEVVNNSYEDWNHNGGVLGGKLSITPAAITGIPLLSKLRIGGMGMRDFNQYAAIPDKDNDHCPDMVDDIKGDGCKYLKSFVDPDSLEYYFANKPDSIQAWLSRANDQRDSVDQSITNRFGKADDFTLVALDYKLPIIETELLNLGIYGEYSRPWLDKDPYHLNKSWAFVPVGVALKVWKLDMGLEYRRINGAFQVGHFDAGYEMERVRYIDGEYLTKEQVAWNNSTATGIKQGIYGRAGMDFFGMATATGTYSHLISKGQDPDRAYTGKLALGETVTRLVPKIALAEIFYNKDHVGTDYYLHTNDKWAHDSFFEPSIYTTYGYRVGMNLGGGMTLVVGKYTSYTHDTEGKLQSQNNFIAETVIAF